MSDWLIAHAGPLRLSAFLAGIALLFALELVRPFRQARVRWRRWSRHLLLLLLGSALLRVAFPLLAIGVASMVDELGYGVFQVWHLPRWLLIPSGIIALDLAIYAQHVAFHRQPWLWRLHRVHHSDTDFDASTGIRFHPLEIALSMLYKIAVVVVLGIPAIAVLIFEILLNLCSLFSHADVALPPRLEARLRRLIVTPEMHRIHHSVLRAETDSNYANGLTIWDRLFRTWREKPERDPRTMPIGLAEFRESREQGLVALLAQPFRRRSDQAAAGS